MQIHGCEFLEDSIEYMQAQRRRQCVLAYATLDVAAKLKEARIDFAHVGGQGRMDHRYLEQELDAPDAKGHFPLLVATDYRIAMRGINYRSSQFGILLLLLQPLPHPRAAA